MVASTASPGALAGSRSPRGRLSALLLTVDAAWRLGPRPVALMLLHRARRAAGQPQRALAKAERIAEGLAGARFLPDRAAAAPALPDRAAARILAAVARLPEAPDWHGPFDPATPSLRLDLFQPGDIRPVWEASRFADLLLLVQAARLQPAAGHLVRAEALLARWCAANPPFRGPAWACGQEAALRALALALALMLLDANQAPPPATRTLLRLCAARIAATPAYAAAQDNNHSLSEPAGAFACAALLGDAAAACRAGRTLAGAVARLVAPDGGFAQVSPGYARLALDVLSVAELLRRRHGLAPFPWPFAERAAALTAWLHRLVAPEDGSTPLLGVEDGSAFADLSLCGPDDARGSVERAARLFGPGTADLAEDAGCAWLGLTPDRAAGAARLARPARWRAEGSMGWAEAGASAVLRCGRLRFRPAQSDLLHLTLRDGKRAILRDGGTGAYNPAATWWWQALAAAAAHNAPVLDGAEPMPRLGRFLLARWPRLRALPDGASCRLANGAMLTRQVAVSGRSWTVTDHVASGSAASAMLRWRLTPGPWRLTADGATDGAIQIRLRSAGPQQPPVLALEAGWESAGYGRISRCIVLRVEFRPAESPITTEIMLPMQPMVAES